jgi:hypothetical protein
LAKLAAVGFVNSLQIAPINNDTTRSKDEEDIVIAAAISQEHKFGRWKRIKEAKNQAMVFVLKARLVG